MKDDRMIVVLIENGENKSVPGKMSGALKLTGVFLILDVLMVRNNPDMTR
jgi:hypothetical protein